MQISQTKPVRVVAPAGDVVELADMKALLSIGDHEADDMLLNSLLASAVARLDGPTGRLGRFLLTQQWRFSVGCFPSQPLRLPFAGVAALEVTYLDSAEEEVTLPTTAHEVFEDGIGSVLAFRRSFVAPVLADDVMYPVDITMTVGYGDASDVPDDIKQAIRMMVASWFEHDDGLASGVSPIPDGVDCLLRDHRAVKV